MEPNERERKPFNDPKRRKDARHPNLGQAPLKKARNPKAGAPSISDNKPETRTCYICKKPGHIAPNCPDKAAHKQNAQAKFFKNKNFMVLWQEAWDDHDEQVCATRVVNSWGDDNLCPICHKTFSLDHRCESDDKRISSKFDGVKAKLRQSPLLKMIQEAHEGVDNQSSSTENSTPFTMDGSFFLEEDEGQQDEEDYSHHESEKDEGTLHSPHSDDDASNVSEESGSDAYRSANSDAESYHSDSDAPF